MKLYELLSDYAISDVKGDTIVDIRQIVIDSKKVKPGDLFICIVGTRVDGHKYISQAIARGAAAIIVSKDVKYTHIPIIRVANTRRAYAYLSAKFHSFPSKSLNLICVIGTNGKTTTTYILKNIFEQAGYKCGIIGTNGCKTDNFEMQIELTTPDPYELNYILRRMVSEKIEYVFMEVSAHAIYLDKMLGIVAKAGILTNVTQDHLDFFKNMKSYKDVKMSYFKQKNMKLGIINSDDECGREIIINKQLPYLTYGIDNPADVFAIDYANYRDGSKYIINLFDEILDIDTPLYGKHNIYNALSAATLAKAMGISGKDIANALKTIKPIAGRFEVIEDRGRYIIIDFAHSPDSLSNLLNATKPMKKNKLITVFGCGGDRDKSKRAIMGEIAGLNSDYTIITSDNPRFEEPQSIINEIEKGIKKTDCEYNSIIERKEAISKALSIAKSGDVVIIAGKGAEDYIDIKGNKYPYSDKGTVMELL